MKKLGMFTTFDWNAFAKGKRFVCTGCSEWKDFDTQQHLGTRVEAVIAADTTDYGEEVTNLYEKVTFKIAKDTAVPLNAEIQPKGVTATVYGEFRNQLSCTVDDIAIISKG